MSARAAAPLGEVKAPDQLDGHRRRGRLGVRGAVEADLAGGVAPLRAQVLPVQVNECLVHDHAQPDEGRRGRTLRVMLEALAGGQERLLQHVLRPQPPPQGLGQPEMDHPPQALPFAGEQLRQRLRVTAPKAALKVFHPDAGIAGHAGLP